MSSSADSSVLVEVGASNLAFRISQWVHRLLLDRSVALATESGCSLVTSEHVELCLDHALFDQLLQRMRWAPF